MELVGHVRNGVIVLEGDPKLPEGIAVIVVLRAPAAAAGGKRVQFPLVRSALPGSVILTNERIAEILDEEDIASRR